MGRVIAMRRGLSPRAIRALELAAADGLTVADIAHRLDVSPATVKLDLQACRDHFDAPTTATAYVRWREGRRTRRKPGAPSLELFG